MEPQIQKMKPSEEAESIISKLSSIGQINLIVYKPDARTEITKKLAEYIEKNPNANVAEKTSAARKIADTQEKTDLAVVPKKNLGVYSKIKPTPKSEIERIDEIRRMEIRELIAELATKGLVNNKPFIEGLSPKNISILDPNVRDAMANRLNKLVNEVYTLEKQKPNNPGDFANIITKAVDNISKTESSERYGGIGGVALPPLKINDTIFVAGVFPKSLKDELLKRNI